MATPSRRFTTTTTGGSNQKPFAILATSKIDTLIGSIIQLDGRQSYDPERQPLTFRWRFSQVPLGSEVEPVGFKDIRPNSTAVSFIPDKTGVYIVELIVNDGELDSDPVTVFVNIQLTRVPVGENIIPDAHFLWSYISDFWKLVEDREKITSIWSSVIQLVGTDLIKLWSNDYNKSLSSIQSTFQRRWQKFSMITDLSEVTDQRIIVGKTDSGISGTSGNIGATPGTGSTAVFYLPLGKVGDGDKTDFTTLRGNYGPKGRVIVIDDASYTIDRVVNQDQVIATGIDLVTTLASSTVTSASGFEEVEVGDILTIKSGVNSGTYRVKIVNSVNSVTLVYPNDPPAGPAPSFQNGSAVSYSLARQFTLAIVNETAIPEGIVSAAWRVPHLLHVPNTDFEADGVRAGDILVFDVTRGDIGLSTEVRAQVVGADRDRIGFELTMQELDPSVNNGSEAIVVESGGVVTVSGLTNMRQTSVGGYLEILNGDNPGVYRIRQYVSEDAVVIDNSLASGADSGNPNIQWVERSKSGTNVERSIFQKIIRDLRIVPVSAGSSDVEAAAEALISFMPTAINLNTRPFSKYGITFKAKKVIHNSVIKVPDELVSAPVLQESVIDPPAALRENLDYLVEAGYLTFVSDLFSLSSPAPEQLWAEVAILDNSKVVERNFGRLVSLSQDDLSQKKTTAPYLSAVKGLFFAYTNGPTVANIRLGLQILLGLPFAEERGVILEVQDNFTVDSGGNLLGRMLVEDLDDANKRTGFRRIYLYSSLVGLEDNPSTLVPYAAGDTIDRFAPISKGVSVVDYIKDPLWWKRSLLGLEILKYFTFKVTVDGLIFNSDDVQFALDFVKSIKPAYTQVLSSALLVLSDDIVTSDVMGGRFLLKFYNSPWGLAATNRAGDMNSQGAVLWNVGSHPFHTRTLKLLKDVQTANVSGSVRATSAVGWDTTMIRARKHDGGSYSGLEYGKLPPMEGDILCILAGQAGATELTPGLYEIETVIDANTLKLGWTAGTVDPDQYVVAGTVKPALNANIFQYGTGLVCCLLRRENPTVLWETDLVTDGTSVVQSVAANFLKNHVRVGDLLCVEVGVNLGEYLIDAIVNQGVSASVSAPVSGISTITGLGGMTAASSGGKLEFLSGINKGVYKIVSYISPTSVTIRHPGALVEVGVLWLEHPRPPYILEDKVALKNPDGTPALLAVGAVQSFRVIRPFFHKPVLERMRFFYNASPSEHILQAGYVSALGIGFSSEWRDVFTPGMVGLPLNVNESANPINDGDFIITSYINSGRVVIDNPSTTSEPSPGGQKVNFLRSP